MIGLAVALTMMCVCSVLGGAQPVAAAPLVVHRDVNSVPASQPSTPHHFGARTDLTSDTNPVMIILDASGSMNVADAPGPRIDAAKTAVIGLIEALPDSSSVGLLAYGTKTDSSDASKAAGCQDIEQLVPVGPVDKPGFITAVRSVSASGYTPMGSALRIAASALPANAPASIVLVSDGVDTCAPPSTCEVAAELIAQNPQLIIHTVGFREDAEAGRELSCVAEAGGGTYRSAADGPGLTAVLQSQVDAAMRPYVVMGTPVQGTPSADDAPLIGVGQFSDTLPAGSTITRHYSVTLRRDDTAHIASTVVPAALRGGGAETKLSVVAQLRDEAGNLCLSTEREADTLLAGKVDPVTAVVSGVVGGPEWSKRCPNEGTFVIAITRDSASSVPTNTEIIVSVEGPVVGPVSAATTIPSGLPVPEATTAVPVIGGASFNSAPTLSNGSYGDSLSTGETRYYKVPLRWGQRVSYSVVVDKVIGVDQRAGYARSAVASPLRQELQLASTSNAAREFGGPEPVSLTGSTLVSVEYGNRASERSDVRLYSQAGDYYLSVGMSYPVDAIPFRTQITLTLAIEGVATAGPVFESDEPNPSPTPSTPRPTGSQPETSEQSDAVGTSDPSDNSSALGPEIDGRNPGPPTVLWILGALGVAAASAAFLTTRRRTRQANRR